MRLSDARKRRGWSQTELGERCGLVRQTISRIERGEMTTQETLQGICQVLDVRLEEITDVQYYVKQVHKREETQKTTE